MTTKKQDEFYEKHMTNIKECPAYALGVLMAHIPEEELDADEFVISAIGSLQKVL